MLHDPNRIPSEGQGYIASDGRPLIADAGSPTPREGQAWCASDGPSDFADPRFPTADAESPVHAVILDHTPTASALADLIAEIRAAHRRRVFAMDQRKRGNLALGAYIRMQLGWSKALPEPDRKRIAGEAARLLDDPAGSEWEPDILAGHAAVLPFEQIEKLALKHMEKCAEQLPVWLTFGEPIRGFGAASLAVIVAEAGDLANYSTHSKLWRRMGLAPFTQHGVTQSCAQWRGGGLSAEDWVAAGYSMRRRSRMWNIGDALIKGNRDGRYRTLYLQRKAYELAREPDMQPIKAHRRAQYYMEKRLLRDLWRAWRMANEHLPEKAKAGVPSSNSHQEAA